MGKLGQVIPLLIVLFIVGAIGFVLYHVSQTATKIGERADKSMAKHNMVFTKDGMKVGVKHVEDEKYVDKTQKYLVKAWNLAEEDKAQQAQQAAAAKRRRG